MLDEILDGFREAQKSAKVDPTPMGLNHCFMNREGRYHAPKSYGNLEWGHNWVAAYAVKDSTLIEKYAVDADGKTITRDGLPVIKRPFDDLMIAATCLCVYSLRNTSLQEIRRPLQSMKRVNGYTRWSLAKIEKTVLLYHPNFDPEKDAVFIFAGSTPAVHSRIALNALWFSQLIAEGSRMTGMMSDSEAVLMERLFPKEVLKGDPEAIKMGSYMYGKDIHTPESAEFLARKAAAYRRHYIKSYDVCPPGLLQSP